MRLRPRSFIGDGGVERSEIDHPHRLRAEHERIEANAVGIDLSDHRRRTDVVEALFRISFDAAVEQMGGDNIDRILQPAPHRVDAASGIPGVARRPIVLLARVDQLSGTATTFIGADPWADDRRQCEGLVGNEGVRLETLLQRRKIGQRLDRRARLALRLRCAIKLAQGVRKAPGHGKDAAGPVLQHQCRALHCRPHAQSRLATYVAAFVPGHPHVDDVVCIEVAPRSRAHRSRRAGGGRTAPKQSGNSLSLEMSKLRCRLLQPLATIDCSGRPRDTLYQTHSRWFTTGLKSGEIASCDTFRSEQI
jgi:hypothetical protein